MNTPDQIFKLLKSEATKAEVVSAVNIYIAARYPNPATRPTAKQFILKIVDDLRRVAAPNSSVVIEAMVLSRSTDQAIKDKYTAKFNQILARYERIEAFFAEYLN